MEERAELLKVAEENTSSPIQTADNESQTDDRQHEKMVQVNNKLKRVLQSFKDKIHRVVTERPDLFDGIGEETSDRLDHLISTVENQTTQINELHAQRDQVDQQLQSEIKELQRYENNTFDIFLIWIFVVLWTHINIKSIMNVQSK
jgi:chromosome segregation ATPase